MREAIKTPALRQRSLFEYELDPEHAGDRVWIRVKDPNGPTEADVGILVTVEGIAIDVYPACDEFNDGPVVSPWVEWADLEMDDA
jgi:hypothetical protein